MRLSTNIEYRGRIVQCYGEVEEDSNYEVVCEAEEDDSCWVAGSLKTGLPFANWKQVVDELSEFGWSSIVEIHAC